MEQQELDTEQLAQQALTLKQQGQSVRQIAAALGISPSRAYRLIKGDETEDETVMEHCEETETASETEMEHSQLDLTLAVARVLDSDEEEIATVLRRVEAAEERAATALRDACTAQGEAEGVLESIASRLATIHDPVTRAQLEEKRSQARADLIEAGATVSILERQHAELHGMLQKLQRRKRELVEQALEREVQAQISQAKERLTAIQTEFIAGLREIQQVLAEAKGRAADLPRLPADLELDSPVPLESLVQVVGALAIGQRRAVNGYCRVKLVRYWQGHPAGNVIETDMRHGNQLWLGGYSEAPQAI